MSKDKHEYFEKTMLEEVVAGLLPLGRRFVGWTSFEGIFMSSMVVGLFVAALVFIVLVANLPSDAEQKQTALDMYHECRTVQELSEEACLLLALDVD